MTQAEQRGCDVLIVDDDVAIREALTALLEDTGYTVLSAANGREALAILSEHTRPRLILLDLMMPIMSGWDFRAAQVQDRALAPIPVVVLSADRDLAAKARALDVAGYLTKPVAITLLLDTIGHYCG